MNTLKRIFSTFRSPLHTPYRDGASGFSLKYRSSSTHTVRVYDPVLKRQSIGTTSYERIPRPQPSCPRLERGCGLSTTCAPSSGSGERLPDAGALSDSTRSSGTKTRPRSSTRRSRNSSKRLHSMKLTGASLSRGMTILTGEEGLVVYDPVLKNGFRPVLPYGALKKAQAGDVLAAAWSDNDLVL